VGAEPPPGECESGSRPSICDRDSTVAPARVSARVSLCGASLEYH